ncbi:MAG TPA: alpha/beta hydrolase [Gaiella sp.]|jgi:pimeloyl-ACP methyl ester carboxylesterase|nr:alpha/beta hydrolase [Gaiella sp.]
MRPSLPLVLVLACALALGLVASGAARPAATDACLQPGDTPVRMKTRDGVSLYGIEVGSGTTGVVLGHQYFSDHCEFMAFARELAGLGYRALSIDFRGNGLSGTGRSNRLDLDVAAAVARLRADGATRVELVGASMGGTAVLVAGSWVRPVVNGIVSLSGPDYFRGMNATKAVERSRVPVRFLVSRDDRPFASDATVLMRRARANDKAIVRYTGAGHGSSILTVPSAHALVLAFLAR